MLQTTLSSLKKTSKERKRLVKSLNEELSSHGIRSTHNPAVISEYMKDITYIRQLADSNNPAELNEALMALGLPMIDSRNPAVIDEQRRLLYSYLIPKTVSGNPVTIKILGNITPKITGLKVTMNPIQDLHGYDYPWVGGEGKNKLQNTATSATINGVTFTVNSDGTVTTNNTASAYTEFAVNNSFSLPSGTYILNGIPGEGSGNTRRLLLRKAGDSSAIATDTGSGSTFTLSEQTTLILNITISNGQSLSNYIFKPMIRLSTVTDATFAPYSNICPISGRTEASVTRTAGEDVETKTHQYSDTIYGGTDDFVNGGATSEWGYIASYDGETLPGEWMSDRDVYAPDTSPTTGAEVVYKLATPTTISTSAEEITLLKGENVLSTDGDSIKITYKQDFT